jgi:Na+-driven multidrug efflux pump
MFTGMKIGLCVGVVVMLLAVFEGDILASVFTGDAAVVAKAAEYLRGFALEAVVTSILFSFIGYYNGHGQTLFVMIQGLAQTFIVRLPMSYLMSIQPDASLTMIGLAAPSATIFGILINVCFFYYFTRKKLRG